MFNRIRNTIRTNRTRIATAAVVASGAAITTLAGAQTAGTLDGAALASQATNGVTGIMSSGGPAVFGLVGLATGVVFLINRVRSLG